jgi:hypothetical protein
MYANSGKAFEYFLQIFTSIKTFCGLCYKYKTILIYDHRLHLSLECNLQS